MDFDTNPTKKCEIYDQHLQEINGVRFTPRQIDVLACLINMRNQGKIAELLGIDSVRTVETHARDIRVKLGNMATQNVIDFIEKSGKKKCLAAYYTQIRIQSLFEEKLRKIASLINRNSVFYLEKCELIKNELFNHFLEHLKIANIKPIKKCDLEADKDNSKIFRFCVIGSNQNDDSSNYYNIYLLFDRTICSELLNQHSDVDFTKSNYYLSTFKVIAQLIGNKSINGFIDEFEKEVIGIDEQQIVGSMVQSKQVFVAPNKKNAHMAFFTQWKIITTICALLAIIAAYGPYHFYNVYKQELIDTKEYVRETLPKVFKDFLVSNASDKTFENNQAIIKEFDQIINLINSGQMQEYLDITSLDVNDIINSIYNLNVISSYYLRDHNAEKAKKISEYSKKLAETYVSHRLKFISDSESSSYEEEFYAEVVAIDFDKLTPDEVYLELITIPKLSEVYTTTIYLLGRACIYQKDMKNAEKYFSLSKYLGKKSGLLQGALSVRNGLLIIKSDEAEEDIKHADYTKAKKLLSESINSYKTIKEDDQVYIMDYIPFKDKQDTAVLKNDINHVIDCNKRIIKLYARLIEIVEDKGEQQHYLDEIESYFNGSNTSKGILEVLRRSNGGVAKKILADSYNSLGRLLLKLYDKNINFSQLKPNLVETLGLADGNDLQIIEEIFNFAKSLSRNTEFVRADAYEGLIALYERMIKQKNIDEIYKQKLHSMIAEITIKRDDINNKLGRSDKIKTL